MMSDYSGWLQRAETFVRGSSALPGEWSLQINIAQALEMSEVQQLEKSLAFELPQFHRDYYLTASACATCRYTWAPYSETLSQLEEFMPHTPSIYGGVEFVGAHNLEEHHDNLIGMADVFEELGGFGTEAAKIARECVPLSEIGNGDCLALHVKAGLSEPQVVYFSHEADTDVESPMIPISNNPDEFLATWERLGYFGPEIWLLSSFLEESPQKLLDAESPIAVQWRSFLRSLAVPIAP